MTTTKPLSDIQIIVLNHAAQRADLMVLPLPPTAGARGAVRQRLLANLLKAALVEEVPVNDAARAGRQDEAGHLVGLRLTAAGRAAVIGNDSNAEQANTTRNELPSNCGGSTSDIASVVPEATSSPAAQPGRPHGKLGRVLDALSTEPGATLEELVTLTGWQPHSARAALTGLRQRGFSITLAEQHGRKAYRLAAAG
jgi:hypothetical protein